MVQVMWIRSSRKQLCSALLVLYFLNFSEVYLHLVIECFSVEMYKGGVELDVVSSPGREGGHLPEGGDIVAGARRCDIRLLHHMV